MFTNKALKELRYGKRDTIHLNNNFSSLSQQMIVKKNVWLITEELLNKNNIKSTTPDHTMKLQSFRCSGVLMKLLCNTKQRPPMQISHTHLEFGPCGLF